MNRVLLLATVLVATACGGKKSFQSLCEVQVPPPPACMTACDPSTAAGAEACPDGYFCAAGGKCDAQCTPGGSECGDGYSCTQDGLCQENGGGSGEFPDANCPAVHFTTTKKTPTVQLLLDQSGSMNDPYGNTKRWPALRQALINPTSGVIPRLQGQVVFGASLYSNKSMDDGTGKQVGIKPCPTVTSTPNRKLNNLAEITTLLNAEPDEDTPTAESIDKIRADFAANPPATGSPPIIVLATDGLPDTCDDADPPGGARQDAASQKSVQAAQAAYAAGIRVFFLFVGNDAAGDHPQQMANAGAGKDPKTGKEKFYTAQNPAELTAAFNEIIGGVVTCDLKLSGKVNSGEVSDGSVSLNGTLLTYGTDWNVDADGETLHILGGACNTLKATKDPVVDATFSCGSVIY